LNVIDFEKINQQLLTNAQGYLFAWFPDGKIKGSEYVALNPKRADNSAGSFSINIHTGVWCDFATGDKGRDLISLYAWKENISQSTAAKKLTNSDFLPEPAKKSKKNGKTGNNMTLCLPVPEDAPPPPETYILNEKTLKPSFVYKYNDQNGDLLCLMYRFNPSVANGLKKKEIRPFTCWRLKNGTLKWESKHMPDKRPLYGLDDLANFPNTSVLVVSGEKCVNAIRYQFAKNFKSKGEYPYIPTTWIGGDDGIGKADFSPIKNRIITWWADNDISSKNSMQRLADIYGGEVLHIEEEKYPKAWDCADAVEAGIDIENFVATNIKPKHADLSLKAPDEIFPHKDEKNKILGTLDNFKAMLKHYGFTAQYDKIKKEKRFYINKTKYSGDDCENNLRTDIKGICALNKFPDKNADRYIDRIAMKNSVNPVAEWINTCKWDKTMRIKQICDAIKCDGSISVDFKNILISKWMLSAIAAAFRSDEDDFRTRGALIFQGKQGIGKTTFLRNLCGANWGGDKRWFGEGITLDPENTDSKFNANKFWITELAELESTTRRSNPILKAFLTSSSNTLRLPYAVSPIEIWSRTVYCGTVNQDDFFQDPTGNSRYWCLPVLEFADIRQINMQQVWAEVKEIYDAKIKTKEEFIWWLSPGEEEQLSKTNEKYEVSSVVGDLVATRLDWELPKSRWIERTYTQVLEDCGMRNVSSQDTRKAGYVLKRLGAIQRHAGNIRYVLAPPGKRFD
jgi:putative DNA primase/helicase